jgi:putative copper resistance protein D
LILASGCAVAWLQLANPADLAATLYGRVLLAKVCLFFVMVGIAAFNRLILVPRSSAARVPAFAALARSVVIEQLVGLSILLVASILATLPRAG